MSPSETQSPPPQPKPRNGEKFKPFVVKVGQTAIPIFRIVPTKGDPYYQFRYYLAGQKKRLTRTDFTEAKEAAREIATNIENGRAQAGAMSAADVQSWTHARRMLTPDDPPLHVIVEEWRQIKAAAPGATVAELSALWQRTRPRGGVTPDADAGLVQSLTARMIESLEESSASSGSTRYATGFRHDLARFAESFGRRSIQEIGSEEIQKWLRGLRVGARRQDNIRSELVTFFRFARDRGHLIEATRTEPEKVPKLSKSGGEVSYYRPAELRKFFDVIDPRWIPWLAIQAFAGLRTSEVARLDWSAFRWAERIISVPATVALKVRRRRPVPIEDNLFAWLAPWHQATGRLYTQKNPVANWTLYLSRHLEPRSGIDWRNNDLRHAYGTYQMARLENAGQVANRMGNSEAKVKSNYDGVGSPAEAKQWFGIYPAGEAASKVIVMPSA